MTMVKTNTAYLFYACENDAEYRRVWMVAMMLWHLGAYSVNLIHPKGVYELNEDASAQSIRAGGGS